MIEKRFPTTTTVTIPVPMTLAQAFVCARAEIEAIPDDTLIKVNVDVPHAASIGMGAAGGLQELLPALGRLPDYDLRPVRVIGTLAAASLHAHLLAIEPRPEDDRLPAMLQEAFHLRDDLVAITGTLERFGLVPAHTSARRRGRGYLRTATDLCALSASLDERWPELESRVPISRAMIERAAELGAELHAALGQRRLISAAKHGGVERRKVRAQAFTLFVRAYDHCRRGVSFLRWNQGDVDRFVPSLYPKRRHRSVDPVGVAVTSLPVLAAPSEPVDVPLSA